jgi:hypothetical protein
LNLETLAFVQRQVVLLKSKLLRQPIGINLRDTHLQLLDALEFGSTDTTPNGINRRIIARDIELSAIGSHEPGRLYLYSESPLLLGLADPIQGVVVGEGQCASAQAAVRRQCPWLVSQYPSPRLPSARAVSRIGETSAASSRLP